MDRMAPCRLLVVEDHADTARSFTCLLKLQGYEVDIAQTFAEAVSSCRTRRYDLLLADIGLPDGDGTDLLGVLGDDAPKKAIAVSAYGMAEDVARSLAAGYLSHITKPFNFTTLLSVIDRVLRGICETPALKN